METTDNFRLIEEKFLEFTGPNDFYYIQIIQRKKDGCDVRDSGNNGSRMVKTYYIRSLDEFRKKERKIKELCISLNARAYIHLNKRDFNTTCLLAAEKYIELVRTGRSEQGFKVYNSVCGSQVPHPPLWLIDYDDSPKNVESFIQEINSCKPGNAYIDQIPTPNGIHIITRRFNIMELPEEKREWVKKDSPTVLFYAQAD